MDHGHERGSLRPSLSVRRRAMAADLAALFAGSVRKRLMNDGVFFLEIRAAS